MPIQSIFARANRTGTFTSANISVPANLTGIYWVRLNILGSQRTDATRNLSLLVEVSNDGGQTWNTYIGLTWVGGGVEKGNGNPGVVVDAGELAGKTIRVTVTVSRQTNVGVDIETV